MALGSPHLVVGTREKSSGTAAHSDEALLPELEVMLEELLVDADFSGHGVQKCAPLQFVLLMQHACSTHAAAHEHRYGAALTSNR
jgi:hypothetical protein